MAVESSVCFPKKLATPTHCLYQFLGEARESSVCLPMKLATPTHWLYQFLGEARKIFTSHLASQVTLVPVNLVLI